MVHSTWNPALLLFLLGLAAGTYGCLAQRAIGPLARVLRLTGGALCVYALLLVETACVVCVAMVGVLPDEIQAYRERFEKALAAAQISVSAASIWLYGRLDPGRLRHELDTGGVNGLRMDRLPASFHAVWLEMTADQKQIAICTAQTMARADRVRRAPRPTPARTRQRETLRCQEAV